MAEHEQFLSNKAIRGELGGVGRDTESGGGTRGTELKAKREKNLMEYIDVSVNNLKHSIMTDF